MMAKDSACRDTPSKTMFNVQYKTRILLLLLFKTVVSLATTGTKIKFPIQSKE